MTYEINNVGGVDKWCVLANGENCKTGFPPALPQRKLTTPNSPLMAALTPQTVNLPDSDPITLLSTPLTSLSGNPGANTGVSVWFGARNLVGVFPSFLSASPHPPKSALELGAGSGLTGIWLARHFPGLDLTLTDGVDEVLPLLRENVGRNCAQDIPSVQSLRWGVVLPKQYDMIYGADLVYERCDAEKVRALARTVRSGLSPVPWSSTPAAPEADGPNEEVDEEVILPLAVPAFPCFLLALTRRSFPLPQLLALFREEVSEATTETSFTARFARRAANTAAASFAGAKM